MTEATASAAPTAAEPSSANLLDVNRRYYDSLWRDTRLVEPHRFNTWPLVQSLVARSRQRLEVAPGLRPRLPIPQTQFVDISVPALRALARKGGYVAQAQISSLPFAAATFDLVCAFDVIEHVEDHVRALAELHRVTTPGGMLLLSMPLHASHWTTFDELVGHCRRYDPVELQAMLARQGLAVRQSGVYGMQPKSSRLLDLGMWWMQKDRQKAMWWYNHILMPLGVMFQRPLKLLPGMIDTSLVDEFVMVCQKKT
jgi:SAM-dependent methyltransferase